MRVFALLVALAVGASPAAFEICQIACASGEAATAAAPASSVCHHGRAGTHPGVHASTSLRPHSGECTHEPGVVIAPGLTAPRRAASAPASALPAMLAPRFEPAGQHARVRSGRHPVESVRLPLAIPLRI